MSFALTSCISYASAQSPQELLAHERMSADEYPTPAKRVTNLARREGDTETAHFEGSR